MVCSSVQSCWSCSCVVGECREVRTAFRPVIRSLNVLQRKEIMGTQLPVLLSSTNRKTSSFTAVALATLVGEPVLLVARTLVFYAFIEVGLTGRMPAENGWGDQLQRLLFGDAARKPKQNEELKFRTRWHPSTKGTLVRRYRVPTVKQGRKLLTAISSLLASDDTFTDASSHKGCQIRRENAHSESVCCHNVRVLLDELPTPHLVVEITVFPKGPITELQYEKAGKIEQVLRTGASI